MNAWNRVIQTIATSASWSLYADFQYGGSGGFLVYGGVHPQEGPQRRIRGFLAV
jgi:hypothetical protein